MTQEEIDLFIKEQEDNYLRAKIYWLPEIERLADEGDWAEFIHRATTVYEVMPEAFEYYYDIPEEMRRDFALSCFGFCLFYDVGIFRKRLKSLHLLLRKS